jgi:glucosylceramidase
VRRGARRFESVADSNGVENVAFENPDGSKTLVVTNIGPEQTVNVRLAGAATGITLAQDSLTTLVWS